MGSSCPKTKKSPYFRLRRDRNNFRLSMMKQYFYGNLIVPVGLFAKEINVGRKQNQVLTALNLTSEFHLHQRINKKTEFALQQYLFTIL